MMTYTRNIFRELKRVHLIDNIDRIELNTTIQCPSKGNMTRTLLTLPWIWWTIVHLPAWRNDLLHAKHSLSSLFTFLMPRIAFTGLTAFEPGRISDNFMKRFDSPTVNEEVPVSRPKKKLISFDQVMRRVSIHASLKMIHIYVTYFFSRHLRPLRTWDSNEM